MAQSFQHMMQSDVFNFLVGPGKQPIKIHTDLVAACSPTMNALVNGSMAEALTKTAILSDISVDDFTRFCQFAYSGDYVSPLPRKIAEDANEPSSRELTFDDLYKDGFPIKKRSKKEMQPDPKAKFKNDLASKYCYNYKSLPRGTGNVANDERLLSHCDQDWAPVFFAHARMYVFADKYNITRFGSRLGEMALLKLHKCLLEPQLYNASIPGVVDLARYVYENTIDDTKSSRDPLRGLVSSFLVCDKDSIANTEEFHALLMEGDPLVKDFWSLVQTNFL